MTVLRVRILSLKLDMGAPVHNPSTWERRQGNDCHKFKASLCSTVTQSQNKNQQDTFSVELASGISDEVA